MEPPPTEFEPNCTNLIIKTEVDVINDVSTKIFKTIKMENIKRENCETHTSKMSCDDPLEALETEENHLEKNTVKCEKEYLIDLKFENSKPNINTICSAIKTEIDIDEEDLYAKGCINIKTEIDFKNESCEAREHTRKGLALGRPDPLEENIKKEEIWETNSNTKHEDPFMFDENHERKSKIKCEEDTLSTKEFEFVDPNISNYSDINKTENDTDDEISETKALTQESSLDTLQVPQSEKERKENVCNVCNKSFSTIYALNRHSSSHTGESQHVCKSCGKSFTQASHLVQHQLTHTGERPHVCNVCGKSFTVATNLTIHKRIHTGERPYVCSFCSRSFVQLSHLTSHKLMHTGEKPFICNYCGKSFTAGTNLTVHKRIHTGEKPYACNICSKSFNNSSALTKHKLIHTRTSRSRPKKVR